MRIALITGATSGIGRATALRLAQDDFNLIITGRRLELLETLKKEIEVKYKRDVLILNFDVRDRKAVEKAIKGLPERWRKIDVLVNNAGLAVGLNHIQDGLIEDWEQMIDTNVKGVLYITRMVSPMMIEIFPCSSERSVKLPSRSLDLSMPTSSAAFRLFRT